MKDLGNLIFILLALIAWVVKEVLERRQSKGGPAESSDTPPGRTGGRASTGEADVLYGRRRLPEGLTAPPLPSPGTQLEPVAPSRETAPRLEALRTKRLGSLGSSPAMRSVLGAGSGGGQLYRRRLRAWALLGAARGSVRREAARRGVLWREVLGPPRALAGPHRAPVRRS